MSSRKNKIAPINTQRKTEKSSKFKNPVEELKKLFKKISNNEIISEAKPIKDLDSKFKDIKTQDIKILIQENLEKLSKEFEKFEQYIKTNQSEKNDIYLKNLLFQMKGYTNDQIKEHKKYQNNILKFLEKANDREKIIACEINVKRHIESKKNFMVGAKKLYKEEKKNPNKNLQRGEWYQVGENHYEAKF